MRALGERAAQRCEEATTPRCRCRCKGAAHGAKRMQVWDLPKDDPHYPAARPPGDEGRRPPARAPLQLELGLGRKAAR